MTFRELLGDRSKWDFSPFNIALCSVVLAPFSLWIPILVIPGCIAATFSLTKGKKAP